MATLRPKRHTVVHPPPRSWLANPSDKPDPWRTAKPDWKPATTAHERALLAAAQDQHRVMFYIRRYRDALGMTNDHIAKAVGHSPDHISAILRGAVHVSLTDLHLIAAAVSARINTMSKQ